ncbi:MAG: 3-hydroxyacyl-ACP dehydratase [Bacteroidales bacterium]
MLYKIIAENKDCYRLRFDVSHQIYQAHFPGNPITPGVCMLEAIGMLMEQKMDRKLRFVRAKNIKFLSILNPLETNEADFNLKIKTKSPQLEVQTVIETAQGVVAKMTTFYE